MCASHAELGEQVVPAEVLGVERGLNGRGSILPLIKTDCKVPWSGLGPVKGGAVALVGSKTIEFGIKFEFECGLSGKFK